MDSVFGVFLSSFNNEEFLEALAGVADVFGCTQLEVFDRFVNYMCLMSLILGSLLTVFVAIAFDRVLNRVFDWIESLFRWFRSRRSGSGD